MAKPPKESYEKLLALLYKRALPEIKTKVPIIKRVLYELGPLDSDQSLLDLAADLLKQKPMESAVADVQAKFAEVKLTNILRFNCRNSFISREDFQNLFPVNRERYYYLDGPLRKMLRFHTVKARDPATLSFLGSYYLVFPNVNQACIYFQETTNKLVNGFDLELQFESPSERMLRRVASPLLSPDLNQDDLPRRLPEDVFELSASKKELISKLANLELDLLQFLGSQKDPLYDLLHLFSNGDSRNAQVLVKNLPFGVTQPALENLLWDYDFYTPNDPQKSILRFATDVATSTSSTIIRFKDNANAKRLVRNYHGHEWDKIKGRSDKIISAPILCEILD